MNSDESYSDEYLNAFVDNQLEPTEKSQVYARINGDQGLGRRVCELRKLHDLVQFAYTAVPGGGENRSPRQRW